MNVIFSVFLQLLFTRLFDFQKWRFPTWYETTLFTERQETIVFLTYILLQDHLYSPETQPELLTYRLADRLMSFYINR